MRRALTALLLLAPVACDRGHHAPAAGTATPAPESAAAPAQKLRPLGALKARPLATAHALAKMARALPPPAADGSVPVSGADYQGYIAPSRAGGWQPTVDDVRRLEAATPRGLADAQAAGKVPASVNLETYARRYTGGEEQGHREIDVAYYCDNDTKMAAEDTQVMGGGACFVHAVYDVDKGTFGGFRVNSGR